MPSLFKNCLTPVQKTLQSTGSGIRTLWNKIPNAVIQIPTATAFTVVASGGALYVLEEVSDWFRREYEVNPNEESDTGWALVVMSILAVSSTLPMTLAMLKAWSNRNKLAPIPLTKHPDEHHHGFLHQVKDFALTGLPPALLDAGGLTATVVRISPSVPFWTAFWPIAAVGIPVSAWMNYVLHSEHAHTKTSMARAFKKLTPTQKAKFVAIFAGILFGHLGQGAIDGAILPIEGGASVTVSIIVGLLTGALLMAGEGYTEGRSACEGLGDGNASTLSNPKTAKLLTGLASAMHALEAVVGLQQLIALIYNLRTGSDLSQETRIIIGSLTLATVWISNIYGVYTATIEPTDNAIESLRKSLSKLCCHRKVNYSQQLMQPLLGDDAVDKRLALADEAIQKAEVVAGKQFFKNPWAQKSPGANTLQDADDNLELLLEPDENENNSEMRKRSASTTSTWTAPAVKL